MKKIVSIIAVLSSAVYLAAGAGLLVFQNVFKPLFMGGSAEYITVYPVQNVLQLIFLGIPCVALGILSLSESSENRKGMDLLLVIYSGIMLVGFGLITTFGGMMNNIVIGRMQGAAALANTGVVSSMFGWIQFLINLALVMLLLRGAISLGEKRNG